MESGYRMAAATSTLRILALLESVTEFGRNHSRSVDLFEGLRGAGSHADAPATALDHPTTWLHDDMYGTGPEAGRFIVKCVHP